VPAVLPPAGPDSRPVSTTTPVSALVAARLGGALALVAAASLSFNALCDLARHAGLNRLAALLPIAVDAFAASALFVAYRLPGDHPARRTTGRTARLALALTVACNALDHLLDLAGYLLTKHVRDVLLVAVASLPPLIVERLLHLQTALVGDSGQAVTDCVTGQESPGCDGHAADLEQDLDDRSGHTRSGPRRPSGSRPEDEHWLAVASPVYRELLARTGRRPTETAFHAALGEAMAGEVPSDASDAAGGRTISLSTAKRIRALVEAHQAENTS
jgi:uncharacterized protein DUF2637